MPDERVHVFPANGLAIASRCLLGAARSRTSTPAVRSPSPVVSVPPSISGRHCRRRETDAVAATIVSSPRPYMHVRTSRELMLPPSEQTLTTSKPNTTSRVSPLESGLLPSGARAPSSGCRRQSPVRIGLDAERLVPIVARTTRSPSPYTHAVTTRDFMVSPSEKQFLLPSPRPENEDPCRHEAKPRRQRAPVDFRCTLTDAERPMPVAARTVSSPSPYVARPNQSRTHAASF